MTYFGPSGTQNLNPMNHADVRPEGADVVCGRPRYCRLDGGVDDRPTVDVQISTRHRHQHASPHHAPRPGNGHGACAEENERNSGVEHVPMIASGRSNRAVSAVRPVRPKRSKRLILFEKLKCLFSDEADDSLIVVFRRLPPMAAKQLDPTFS